MRGARRSVHWPALRKKFLSAYPTCAACGSREKLEAHHIKPFHLFPARELDPSNLITLCESKKNGVNCHLFFGHLGNFDDFNPSVVTNAFFWLRKIRNRGKL